MICTICDIRSRSSASDLSVPSVQHCYPGTTPLACRGTGGVYLVWRKLSVLLQVSRIDFDFRAAVSPVVNYQKLNMIQHAACIRSVSIFKQQKA